MYRIVCHVGYVASVSGRNPLFHGVDYADIRHSGHCHYHCACGMRNPFSGSYDSKHGRKQKEYAPDLSFCESYDRGVIELLSTVESELRVHCSLSVDDYMAEAILAGNNNMLVDENAVKIAKETANNYATALIRTISEKIKDDFKTSYFIFMGGGSAMMRESIERAIDTKNLFFLTDVTANAKGYEIMARAKLTMSGEI